MLSRIKIGKYTCIETLLENQYAGRTTFLAQDKDGKNVVLKKFEFANPKASWSSFEAIEKEVKLLQKLNHPQISRYLDYFEIEYGYVLVIEYINAAHLGKFKKRFKIEEVKAIAFDILNILIYLQQQNPPIVHRDIKPENILWDGKKAYLIDFGIATTSASTVTLTKTTGGTIGFTPPEIFRCRKATFNSDLYSLGATLFCLLNNIGSSEISNYISYDGTFDWSQCALDVSEGGYIWLQELSHPNTQVRTSTPDMALANIDVLKPKFKGKAVDKIKEISIREIEEKRSNKRIDYRETPRKAEIKPQKPQRKLNVYQKAFKLGFNVLAFGNIVTTLIMTALTISPLSPSTFLALNILQEENSNNFTIIFLTIGLYITLSVFNVIVYNDSEASKSKTIDINKVLLLCANLFMRFFELVCFYLIYINPNYYY